MIRPVGSWIRLAVPVTPSLNIASRMSRSESGPPGPGDDGLPASISDPESATAGCVSNARSIAPPPPVTRNSSVGRVAGSVPTMSRMPGCGPAADLLLIYPSIRVFSSLRQLLKNRSMASSDEYRRPPSKTVSRRMPLQPRRAHRAIVSGWGPFRPARADRARRGSRWGSNARVSDRSLRCPPVADGCGLFQIVGDRRRPQLIAESRHLPSTGRSGHAAPRRLMVQEPVRRPDRTSLYADDPLLVD